MANEKCKWLDKKLCWKPPHEIGKSKRPCPSKGLLEGCPEYTIEKLLLDRKKHETDVNLPNPDYMTDDEIRANLITLDYKGKEYKAVIVEYLLSIKKLYMEGKNK